MWKKYLETQYDPKVYISIITLYNNIHFVWAIDWMTLKLNSAIFSLNVYTVPCLIPDNVERLSQIKNRHNYRLYLNNICAMTSLQLPLFQIPAKETYFHGEKSIVHSFVLIFTIVHCSSSVHKIIISWMTHMFWVFIYSPFENGVHKERIDQIIKASKNYGE